MNAVAIIPARGGSTRIPRKNIRPFMGKPIIAYSIETAKQSGLFSSIIVSSDDQEIQRVALQYGASIQPRTAELSQNEVGTQEVMRSCLERATRSGMSFRHACCIYATAPLMTVDDLRRGYEILIRRLACYAFSVGTTPLQDAGQFYWGTTSAFLDSVSLYSDAACMVPIDSRRVCDINTEEDWVRAEQMYLSMREGL